MNSGYIKLFRKIKDWEWYDDHLVTRVFIHLLLSANYEGNYWQGRLILAGQLVIGYGKLAAEVSVSIQQLRTAFEKLKKTGEIQVESTNRYTIVTVCNWAEYQVEECDFQQTDNKQITTTKKRNKKSRIKEMGAKSLEQTPNVNDIIDYMKGECSGYDIDLRHEANVFYSHYSAIGWKMGNTAIKDWRSAVNKWLLKSKSNGNERLTKNISRVDRKSGEQTDFRIKKFD